MNIDDEYPSNWLKYADLDGAAHVVEIEAVKRETVGETTQPAVHFEPGLGFKPLLLNKSNKEVIKNMYGRETETWIGKLIELFPDRVLCRSEMVEYIRVGQPDPTSQSGETTLFW